MRILILTAIFPPEIRSQATLFYEIAAEFQRRGHEVAVITKVPNHYVSNGDAESILPGWSVTCGIPTFRIKRFPLSGRQPFVRGLEHLSLGYSFARASKRWPNADVVIVYSPPLPLALSALRYRREFGAPFVLNVQDIYPQTAIDLGLLRNRIGIELAERMELRAYAHASRIVVHSPGNRELLVARKKVPDGKLRVIYNWVDTAAIYPRPNDESFRAVHSLQGKFVVSYAGLMGFAQDLGTIIGSANLLRDDNDVVFLLVGEGVLEPQWRQMVKDHNLQNVRFLPLQPKERYSDLLAASDVCLVPLSGNLRTPVVPGKLQSIMASGRPAITIVESNGDTPKLINASGSGVNVMPGKPKALTDAIMQLKANPALREEMGRRGRAFAETNFCLARSADAYEALFMEILNERATNKTLATGGLDERLI